MLNREPLKLDRCPHCRIAKPNMPQIYEPMLSPETFSKTVRFLWSAYRCETCGGITSAVVEAALNSNHTAWVQRNPDYETFPEEKQAAVELPPVAKRYLQQAFDTLHAPDASVVMANSAIDAMLKEKGFSKGSVYDRLREAVAANVLTQGMADWAHAVRIDSNKPRHADGENQRWLGKFAQRG